LFLGSRPYAGKGVASTTELINLLNLGDKARKFAWNGAEAAAVMGVHHSPEWYGMPSTVKGEPCSQDHRVEPGLCKACKFLRSEFDRRWKAKAALGEHVHHLAASWARGDDVESDGVVDPYLDGLEEWYRAYEPTFVAVEQTVHYQTGPRQYVGTFDLLAEHNCPCPLAEECRCRSLMDIKTGEFQADKDWLLQLSAYRYAESLTRWEDGRQQVTGPMPTVAHTGVLWLHPGRAEMVEVHTNHQAFNNFLRLIDLHNWEKAVDKELAELKFEAEVDAQVEALEEEGAGV
jgi:hypothetical protein